jgi:hypothetical protein
MNQAIFTAQNELEKKLLLAMDGDMSGEDFIAFLMNTQVFMPIEDLKDATNGVQQSTKTQPLVVEDEKGNDVLILFTSPARASEFVKDFEGYGGGLLMEFSWVLRKLDGPLNIAINPGFEAGFDMDTEMIADLMATLPEEVA